MNKQIDNKAIEEMAKIIGESSWDGITRVECYVCAEALYNAGYRDEKETAREILKKIAEIHTENIGYTDWLDDTYFGDEFDKIAKRFGLKTKQLKHGVEVE